MKFFSPLLLIALAATSMLIARGVPTQADQQAPAAVRAKAIHQQKPLALRHSAKMPGMTQKALEYEKARQVAAHRKQQSAKQTYQAKSAQGEGTASSSK